MKLNIKEIERIESLSYDSEFINKVNDTNMNNVFEYKEHFYLINQSTYTCFNCIFQFHMVECGDIPKETHCKKDGNEVEIIEISKEYYNKVRNGYKSKIISCF